jgi:hypothetical protein
MSSISFHRDILTDADDDVLASPGDANVPVRVHDRQIASCKSAIGREELGP